MSDIVERLRNELGWGIGPALLCQTAADEIERLREALESIIKTPRSEAAHGIIQVFARAALEEK